VPLISDVGSVTAVFLVACLPFATAELKPLSAAIWNS
jgi:hypothetical protein